MHVTFSDILVGPETIVKNIFSRAYIGLRNIIYLCMNMSHTFYFDLIKIALGSVLGKIIYVWFLVALILNRKKNLGNKMYNAACTEWILKNTSQLKDTNRFQHQILKSIHYFSFLVVTVKGKIRHWSNCHFIQSHNFWTFNDEFYKILRKCTKCMVGTHFAIFCQKDSFLTKHCISETCL